MQHGGLQGIFGKWHRPIADAMREFGQGRYEIATSSTTVK
jgi:hypothetical protein